MGLGASRRGGVEVLVGLGAGASRRYGGASAPASDLESRVGAPVPTSKQRHLDDLRGRAARLRTGNRDLATRLRGVQARAALVQLTNTRLRAKATSLARRLNVASRALALRQIYAASSASAGSAGAGHRRLL